MTSATAVSAAHTHSTPIGRALRAWFIVEVLFGLGAISAVGLDPANTRANFAWPINPVVMAAVLGAFYISSALLFVLPVFAQRWEMVRVMILPAAIFSTVQLLATFLHWDKFSVGTPPFAVWFASYLLPPPIFVAAYVRYQRRTSPPSFDRPLPSGLRRLMLGLGSVLAIGAGLTFIAPDLLIANFPWPLTPLTARSLSAWWVATGLVLLSMARENDAARALLGAPTLVLLLPAVTVQMLRYAHEVNFASPVLWAGLILLGAVGVCGLGLLARGDWRAALS